MSNGSAACCFVLVHGILSSAQHAWETPPAGQTPAIEQMAAQLAAEFGPATPEGQGVNLVNYRWEQGVKSGAMELLYYIDALAQDTAGPIYLIGHSMGGLVCRYYLEQLADRPQWHGDRVAALVTLATPHQGSQLYVRSIALLEGNPLTAGLAEVAAGVEAGLRLEDHLHLEALSHVQFLADLVPGSDLLRTLNSPWTPPPRTTYIAAGVPDDLIVMDYPGEIMQGFLPPGSTPAIVRPDPSICRDRTPYSGLSIQHNRHASLNYNERFAGWLADTLREVQQGWTQDR